MMAEQDEATGTNLLEHIDKYLSLKAERQKLRQQLKAAEVDLSDSSSEDEWLESSIDGIRSNYLPSGLESITGEPFRFNQEEYNSEEDDVEKFSKICESLTRSIIDWRKSQSGSVVGTETGQAGHFTQDRDSTVAVMPTKEMSHDSTSFSLNLEVRQNILEKIMNLYNQERKHMSDIRRYYTTFIRVANKFFTTCDPHTRTIIQGESDKFKHLKFVVASNMAEDSMAFHRMVDENFVDDFDIFLVLDILPPSQFGRQFSPCDSREDQFMVREDLASRYLQHARDWIQTSIPKGTSVDIPLGTSVDIVAVVQLDFWPPTAHDWIMRKRQWPPVTDIMKVLEKPTYLVHMPGATYPDGTAIWRLSFTSAEQILFRELTEGMGKTYFLFKILYYKVLKCCTPNHGFSSYLAKTVMMWACEELPPAQWTDANIEQNLTVLLNKLLSAFDKRYLPHYFLPPVNLLVHIHDPLLEAFHLNVDKNKLLTQPLTFLTDDMPSYAERLLVSETHQQIQQRMLDKLSQEMMLDDSEEEMDIVAVDNGDVRAMLFLKMAIESTAIQFTLTGLTKELRNIGEHVN